jgi:hypothetical protein
MQKREKITKLTRTHPETWKVVTLSEAKGLSRLGILRTPEILRPPRKLSGQPQNDTAHCLRMGLQVSSALTTTPPKNLTCAPAGVRNFNRVAVFELLL